MYQNYKTKYYFWELLRISCIKNLYFKLDKILFKFSDLVYFSDRFIIRF